jgi:gamma-tubulin complex component 3
MFLRRRALWDTRLKVILSQVSKPFFATLHRWLFSGELYDPFSEFFVAIDPNLANVQYVHPSTLVGGFGQLSGDGGFTGLSGDTDEASGDREGGLRLWEAKYRFQKDMLPMFVGESFGKKAFLSLTSRCETFLLIFS